VVTIRHTWRCQNNIQALTMYAAAYIRPGVLRPMEWEMVGKDYGGGYVSLEYDNRQRI
jgi:hypothetical protein